MLRCALNRSLRTLRHHLTIRPALLPLHWLTTLAGLLRLSLLLRWLLLLLLGLLLLLRLLLLLPGDHHLLRVHLTVELLTRVRAGWAHAAIHLRIAGHVPIHLIAHALEEVWRHIRIHLVTHKVHRVGRATRLSALGER